MHKNNSETGLKIIIVGCGKVGVSLTQKLVAEGHDITLIDKNIKKIQEITKQYDVMGITGNGASYSIQMEAGIEDADLLIAVTESDELNLLCCTVAKRVGDCAAIARVRTPDYSKEISYLQEKLGLAMIINPELEAAREATHILALPMALEVNTFAHGQAELIKIKIEEDNKMAGKTLIDMGRNNKDMFKNVLVCAVERDEEVYIPDGNFLIRTGDVVSLVACKKTAKPFLKNIGFRSGAIHSCMIIGGGRAGYYLANMLLGMGAKVKIIESNLARCELLSDLLPNAIIINGDGTNEDLLKEEGIQRVDSFVPLTGIDEENIMLTLYAKNVSKAKIITKINRITFNSVINNLDLGSVIYPKNITAEAIVAYVRAKKNSMQSNNIETLYHMYDSRVEAIEFRVAEQCEITDIPLMDLNIKSEILISCINRNGKIIIPTGQDCIKAGDTVMLVTKHIGFDDIRDILA